MFISASLMLTLLSVALMVSRGILLRASVACTIGGAQGVVMYVVLPHNASCHLRVIFAGTTAAMTAGVTMVWVRVSSIFMCGTGACLVALVMLSAASVPVDAYFWSALLMIGCTSARFGLRNPDASIVMCASALSGSLLVCGALLFSHRFRYARVPTWFLWTVLGVSVLLGTSTKRLGDSQRGRRTTRRMTQHDNRPRAPPPVDLSSVEMEQVPVGIPVVSTAAPAADGV